MKYIYLILLVFLQIQSSAQVTDNIYSGTSGRLISKNGTSSNLYVEITPTYTFPTGDLSDIYNNGYGGLFSINHRLKSSAVIFVEGGYVSFKGKQINVNIKNSSNKTVSTNSFTPPSFIHIPISFGVKYYEGNFIWGIGIGTGISKLDVVDMESSTKLMINPIVGYDFGAVILGANYSITTTDVGATNKYLGVRLSLKLN
jgi:hypothetical protein